MSKGQRTMGLAVAQMGPVHLADTRKAVVARLVEMLREAHGRGAELVVFPELALTTFFPRYWMSDDEAQARFFEAQMPNAEVQPLLTRRAGWAWGFTWAMPNCTPKARRTTRPSWSIAARVS